MVLVLVVFALVAVAAISCAYCIYSGLLYFPIVRAVAYPLPPLTVAYKYRQKDYSHCLPLYKELSQLAPGEKHVALYYDNPDKVPGDKQRFLVGCVVAESGSDPNSDLLRTLKNNGYSIFHLPVCKTVIMTSFPFKNKLSVTLCNRRVWYALAEYLMKRHMWSQPWIELLGGPDMLYIVPMDNQEAFHVPEARE